jgi:hypothetical protein
VVKDLLCRIQAFCISLRCPLVEREGDQEVYRRGRRVLRGNRDLGGESERGRCHARPFNSHPPLQGKKYVALRKEVATVDRRSESSGG